MIKENKKKISLSKLKEAIEKSWSKETCYPIQQKDWTNDNPALGQCAVTALVLQDYLGGEIAYNSELKHYWNILPSNKIIDLTRKQFINLDKLIVVDQLAKRDVLLFGERAEAAKTNIRYALLKEKIIKYLENEY